MERKLPGSDVMCRRSTGDVLLGDRPIAVARQRARVLFERARRARQGRLDAKAMKLEDLVVCMVDLGRTWT